MRIISGKFGGRRITPPSKMPHTRPTSDMAKEGLFNVLEHSFSLEGSSTLELFGGTGNVSFELASRGAEEQVVVEKDRKLTGFIAATAKEFGLPLKVVQADVFKYMERCKMQFDLIFADPPYALSKMEQMPDLVFQHGLLKKGGWFILEHTAGQNFADHPYFVRRKNYGSTIFSIFIWNE